jgi:hypothetical protein
VELERNAAAGRRKLLDRDVEVVASPDVEPRDRADAFGVQWRQPKRGVRAQGGGNSWFRRRGQHDHRRRRRPEIAGRGQPLLAGAIDVVEHHERRARRGAGGDQ